MPLRHTNSAPTESSITEPVPNRLISGLAIAFSGLLIWLIPRIALGTKWGLKNDNEAMNAVYAHSSVEAEILDALGVISISTALVAVLVMVLFAMMRGRKRAALGILVLVGGANITAQILKHQILDRPNTIDLLPNSLPSGHTTLVVTLALGAIAVSPRGFRYSAVFGASVLATLTGASTVVAGWHRPADIFAALVIGFFWGAIVTFVLGWHNKFRPGATASAALAGALVAGMFLIAIGVRPTGGWAGFTDAALVFSAMGGATALTMAAFARMITPHP